MDDADRAVVSERRNEHNRLGFALQLGTVRYLGTFLAAPLEVPWPVVEYLGRQLRVFDVSVVKAYGERPATVWEHQGEIRLRFGYVEFAAGEAELRAFLAARAWTRTERPVALFDRAVAWLRARRVLLPGVSVLARLVAEVRVSAAERFHSALALAAEGVDGLPGRLDGLLVVADGMRASELERLRRAPVRASGTEMVRALERVAELNGLGAGGVTVEGVPPGRLEVLARYGLTSKARMLRRLPDGRRTATLLATARQLEVAAVDDTLDLFSGLMATRLLAWAERQSAKARLRSLPQLERASATLAAAARVLLESMATGEAVSVADLWVAVEETVPRARLLAAVSLVEDLAPADDNGETARRAELVKRYSTVRPFLGLLAEVVPFRATDAGAVVLDAVRALPGLVGRKRVRADEVALDVVPAGWRRLVLEPPDLPSGSVDHRAYAICVLEALYRALRRRDVYVAGSGRWGDPRARLLDGPAWQAAKAQISSR